MPYKAVNLSFFELDSIVGKLWRGRVVYLIYFFCIIFFQHAQASNAGDEEEMNVPRLPSMRSQFNSQNDLWKSLTVHSARSPQSHEIAKPPHVHDKLPLSDRGQPSRFTSPLKASEYDGFSVRLAFIEEDEEGLSIQENHVLTPSIKPLTLETYRDTLQEGSQIFRSKLANSEKRSEGLRSASESFFEYREMDLTEFLPPFKCTKEGNISPLSIRLWPNRRLIVFYIDSKKLLLLEENISESFVILSERQRAIERKLEEVNKDKTIVFFKIEEIKNNQDALILQIKELLTTQTALSFKVNALSEQQKELSSLPDDF